MLFQLTRAAGALRDRANAIREARKGPPDLPIEFNLGQGVQPIPPPPRFIKESKSEPEPQERTKAFAGMQINAENIHWVGGQVIDLEKRIEALERKTAPGEMAKEISSHLSAQMQKQGIRLCEIGEGKVEP